MKNRNYIQILATRITLVCLLATSSGAWADVYEKHSTYGNSIFVNVHPVRILAGTLDGDVGVGINNHWGLGLSGLHSEAWYGGQGYYGSSLGLVGFHFVNGESVSTPYIKFGVGRGFLDVDAGESDEFTDNSSHVDYNQLGLMVGYHWIWMNGMNVKLGAGANYLAANANSEGKPRIEIGSFKTRIPGEKFSGIVPMVELSLGMTFLR